MYVSSLKLIFTSLFIDRGGGGGNVHPEHVSGHLVASLHPKLQPPPLCSNWFPFLLLVCFRLFCFVFDIIFSKELIILLFPHLISYSEWFFYYTLMIIWEVGLSKSINIY